MKIGIDLDGVLRDIVTPLCRLWKSKTGISKTPDDILGWGIHLYLEIEKAAMSPNDFYQWWFNYRLVYTLARTIPGSQDAVARLATDHKLILVSSQPTPNAKLWSLSFVYTHFPDKFDAIFFGGDKSLVYLDAMIDDGIHNLEPNVARHRILFDQPWNQDAPSDIYRAKGWQGVLDYIYGRRWE